MIYRDPDVMAALVGKLEEDPYVECVQEEAERQYDRMFKDEDNDQED